MKTIPNKTVFFAPAFDKELKLCKLNFAVDKASADKFTRKENQPIGGKTSLIVTTEDYLHCQLNPCQLSS